ncbi:MAG: hypothetical protein ACFFDN_47340 [Candidatus Hodarchaeota archaeon]
MSIQNKIKTNLEKDLRSRLGLTSRQAIPLEYQTIIDAKSKEASSKTVEQYIGKQAILAGKSLLAVKDYRAAVNERLGSALEGVQTVTLNPQLQEILNENAKMLFAKKTALVTAGFSDEEAFRLLVAEVSAKKAK